MSLAETLTWPFFEAHHRRFADELARWADATLPGLPHDDVDAACRARVAALGQAGFLKAAVPAEFGGLHEKLDVRDSLRFFFEDGDELVADPLALHFRIFDAG